MKVTNCVKLNRIRKNKKARVERQANKRKYTFEVQILHYLVWHLPHIAFFWKSCKYLLFCFGSLCQQGRP